MNLNFYGDMIDLEKGIKILEKELNFGIDNNGINIKVYKTEKNIEVSFKDGNGYIGYNKKIHFFRALGLFLETIEKNNNFNIVEEPQFKSNGAMFDCSRNGVLTVKTIKNIIRKMALMGLNTFMLYNEDTYEINGYPYFGYMRGRYSYDELKACDDYANIFGIEIIPCIQTLAHLTQALKWSVMNDIKDTSDILLVGDDKVYDFIEDMIKVSSIPFRSKKIHIGMDEAHKLGLGEYLKRNGYENKIEIMKKHLNKVLTITDKYGLEPMIWSDMFSWNVTEKDDLENMVPKNVSLVYWDYYNHFESSYEAHIKKHRRFGSNPIFAGGLWTSMGMVPWYDKTFATMTEALRACKKEGVKEIFATMWGNNGQEVNILTAMLGLQFFAEQGYSKELDFDKLKNRFKFCTKGDYNAFKGLSLLNDILGYSKSELYYNPSKCLLWQDILIGLFDKHVEGVELKEYYSKIEEKMKRYKEDNKEWNYIFDFTEKLSNVLKLKGDMGIRIKKYYDENNMKELKEIINNELPQLYKSVEQLRVSHRNQWFITYKPFGWEALDLRYGGVLARISSIKDRLEEFIEGRIDKIEELEEERLYFDGEKKENGFKLPFCNNYTSIISTSPMN